MTFGIEYLMCNVFCYTENHCFFDIDDVHVFALNQVQEHHNCIAHPFAMEVIHSIFFICLSLQPSSRNKTFIKLMGNKNNKKQTKNPQLLVKLRYDKHLLKSQNEPRRVVLLTL